MCYIRKFVLDDKKENYIYNTEKEMILVIEQLTYIKKDLVIN